MHQAAEASHERHKTRGIKGEIVKELKRRWRLYLMILVPAVYVFIFYYIPMSGVLIAFQDYSIRRGISGSTWIGLKHFVSFFTQPTFIRLVENTVLISLYGFIAGFPLPIILALSLNECNRPWFKKTVQMVTYAPYFISTVVMVSIVIQFLHARTGMINNIRSFVLQLGPNSGIDFMGNPYAFRHIYVWSGVWQGMGYSAVIYLAALSGIDPSLQEAAIIDGANRFQRVWHVDLPTIMPTIVISMILSVGGLLSVGYEKVYLLQNSSNLSHSEVINTFVYKRGLEKNELSYATAVGLFNSVANMVLLASANWVARRINETSLW